MNKCKNCGYDSHCGISLNKTVDQVLSGIEDRQIQVCKQCRCSECTIKTDWG